MRQEKVPSVVRSWYSQVPHLHIQPSADGNDLEKCYVVADVYCRPMMVGCDCTEHVQTFSLSLFPKQCSVTIFCIAFVI